MLLFKKLLCFLVFLLLTITLTGIVSSSEINHSVEYKSSVAEINKSANSLGVFVTVNQAANFNHLNQITIDYILVALLVLFVTHVVNYQWYKPTTSPPCWYIVLRYGSRLYISGWKASNLQYKVKLTSPH
ncbi:hypothetical protein [Thalassotalea profundi]|uniref:hypothetical protein n=1 Tax=Thalassotalea profundi TaxID=2036687 RepID=UPI001E546254|nr:hypothetical protein [Thalassotalea profundi]